MDRWCIPLTVCAVALCVLFPSVKAKLKGDECEGNKSMKTQLIHFFSSSVYLVSEEVRTVS